MAEARDTRSSETVAPAIFRLPPATLLDDGRYNVTVVYLEMTKTPPETANLPPLVPKLALLKLDKPTTSFYRYLYDAVGRPWHWVDRHRMTDLALGGIITDPLVEIWVPYVGGVPAGYIELDRRNTDADERRSVNIAYFGLTAEFFGRGIGPWLLRAGIRQAWSSGIDRLTVNTCNLDHPAALPLYQKCGFRPYQTRDALFDPRR